MPKVFFNIQETNLISTINMFFCLQSPNMNASIVIKKSLKPNGRQQISRLKPLPIRFETKKPYSD
jgi:hypothetical protein